MRRRCERKSEVKSKKRSVEDREEQAIFDSRFKSRLLGGADLNGLPTLLTERGLDCLEEGANVLCLLPPLARDGASTGFTDSGRSLKSIVPIKSRGAEFLKI